MQHRLVDPATNTHLLVLAAGDEIADTLKRFAAEREVGFASFTAIGALSKVELLAFDSAAKTYKPSVRLDEQCELASMIGNVGRLDGDPVVHAHVTVGRLDGVALAGHLKSATVRPTCELVLRVYPTTAEKKIDPEFGLPLYTL